MIIIASIEVFYFILRFWLFDSVNPFNLQLLWFMFNPLTSHNLCSRSHNCHKHGWGCKFKQRRRVRWIERHRLRPGWGKRAYKILIF